MTARSRLLLLVLLAALLAAAAWAWYAFDGLRRAGLPWRTGTHGLAGLAAEAEVRYDAWGVPHVRAASVRDLAAAVGWVQANDRMEQMELARRAAAGRLSELIGADGLEMDLRLREMRLHRTAEALVAAAGERTRTWLEGYATGVNAWIAARGEDLPPLFRLTGTRPEPWRAADSMAMPLLMSLQLSLAFGPVEEERYLALRALGEERFHELWGAAAVHPALLAEGPPPAAPANGPAGDPASGGSNNWAVSAAHTATGAPLFANDPHLELRLPSVWYQVHLRCPDYEAAGVGLLGIPGVVIGHNADLAWGFTNVMLDDRDLLLEELSEDGRRVRRASGWEEIVVERETVAVRDGEAAELELWSTSLGPMLPPDEERGLPARTVLWTAYHPADLFEAFLGIGTARDLEQVRSAAGRFVSPAQNLVAVHRDGGLLHTVLGRLPARRSGDGRLPAPAWDPAAGWSGLQPAEAAFVVRDPASGRIVTANHDVRPPRWEGSLSADFDLPHRARRIEQLLEAGEDWTAEGLAAMQPDVRDLYALELVSLLGEPEFEGDAARALEALRGWDGARAAEGPAALFQAFERELAAGLYRDDEEEAGLAESSFFFRRPQLLRALAGGVAAAWWDDLRTEETEDREALLASALGRAWRAVGGAEGDYAGRHTLTLEHPLSAVPLLGRWFTRGPFPIEGSATTVAAFGGDWTGRGIEVSYGPSLRFVADPADWERSSLVLPGGQSSHPGDPHYDDQLPLYLAGRTRPMPWSEAAVEAATVSRVLLEP